MARRLRTVGLSIFGKSILGILRSPFYIGKFRWQKEVFDGEHESIISDATFEAANLILEKRSADSPGKMWHNQNQRVFSGLMRCGRCNSAMVGVSCISRGVKISYYACRKRLDTKDCDQDYIRTDWIEDKIMDEVQTVFQDEALLESIWESAQKKLAANAPAIDAELKHLHDQRVKSQAALDRYFNAFESGTMNPAACSQRIEDLSTQIKQLDDQRQALKDKRSALDLPAIKTDFLNEILSNLREVVESVPIPQKKHLLHLLVKKVLIRDKHTFEVWYRLPQFPGVRTLSQFGSP